MHPPSEICRKKATRKHFVSVITVRPDVNFSIHIKLKFHTYIPLYYIEARRGPSETAIFRELLSCLPCYRHGLAHRNLK